MCACFLEGLLRGLESLVEKMGQMADEYGNMYVCVCMYIRVFLVYVCTFLGGLVEKMVKRWSPYCCACLCATDFHLS